MYQEYCVKVITEKTAMLANVVKSWLMQSKASNLALLIWWPGRILASLSLTPLSLLTHCYLRTRESILVPTFFVSCFCLKVLVVCSLLSCCLLLFPCIPIYDWVLATVWCHHRPYFSSIACLGTWLPILKVPELAHFYDAQITGKCVLVFFF